ncbi:MAG TPA: MFS transporter [Pyrinomonadaceae bacterium]|nr:MFS transporter [Pyrinomonadaceae bacterium]
MENSIASVAPSGSPEPAGKSAAVIHVPRYSYYALTVLTLVNFLNYIDRQVLPAVAPAMRKELNLSQTEIGFLEDALLLSYVVLALVFGRLGDRYSRTKLMAAAAAVWSLATGLTALTDKSPWLPSALQFRLPVLHYTVALSGVALALCAVRALVGVGESSYSTITPTLIADYFPVQRRATALGVFQAAIPMGFALGYAIGGALAYFFGWRMAFMVVGLPGLITAVIVWRLNEPERGQSDRESGATLIAHAEAASESQLKKEPWVRTCWRILRTRNWLLSTGGYTALSFVLGAFATWASSLLQEEKHMSALGANVVLGVTTLAAGAAGTFGGGWIADRVAAKRRNGYFLVCAASSLLGVVPAFLALVTHQAYLFIPAIFFTVFFLFINNAPFHAILVNSVPPAIRATAMALNIVVIHSFGDLISRLGVGVLSDSLAAGRARMIGSLASAIGIDPVREHLTTALLVVPVGLLVSALFFFWGGRQSAVKVA